LAQCGGSTVADVVRAILKKLMATSVAITCNWKGIGNKYALGASRLQDVICGKYLHTFIISPMGLWGLTCRLLTLIRCVLVNQQSTTATTKTTFFGCSLNEVFGVKQYVLIFSL